MKALMHKKIDKVDSEFMAELALNINDSAIKSYSTVPYLGFRHPRVL
jgi:hypothetical protein